MGPRRARLKSASVVALAGPRTSHRRAALPALLGDGVDSERGGQQRCWCTVCEQAPHRPPGTRLRVLRGRPPLLHPLTPRHWTAPARTGRGARGALGQPRRRPFLEQRRGDALRPRPGLANEAARGPPPSLLGARSGEGAAEAGGRGRCCAGCEASIIPLLASVPFLVAFPFLAAASSEAGRQVIFVCRASLPGSRRRSGGRDGQGYVLSGRRL